MTGKKHHYMLTFLIFFTIQGITQQSIVSRLSLDGNINYANKKRSYSVYSDNKYANSGYFWGLDFRLLYRVNQYEFGFEMLPYRHFGITAGKNLFDLRNYEKEFGITPNIKAGYSPRLKKVYYGTGVKFSYKWFHIGYDKILHVKSGNSRYHGDGLDSFSIGMTFNTKMLNREIKPRTIK